MISKKVNHALNVQINAEFFSSYLYLSMSAWLGSKNLTGFSSWMRAQAQEELFHATKMYDYVIERGGEVELFTIEQPKSVWTSASEVMSDVVDHEAKVTGMINDLLDVSIEERDHAASIFLQWFVAEQVEEEATVGGVFEKMKLIGGDTAGLFVLDVELAKRQFVPPVAG
ncbi:ferritin [Desulfotalea psychrophila]|uniref:Ferritin n=1 Tax=Desulfotalea psychrophila (strain LSv54 / DSM 12343) TaxID=177439 RepID=Q6AMM6_DESPS|nr:ferritin [Desulfotalea psychrophila]CAG36399.1 probable ferritin [Desulfotalea psychrophila LSv54]